MLGLAQAHVRVSGMAAAEPAAQPKYSPGGYEWGEHWRPPQFFDIITGIFKKERNIFGWFYL